MPQTQITRDQHLVSATLVKPWADAATGQLGWYSLEHGKSYKRAPSAVAKKPDFLKWNAVEMEHRWQLIENHIPELREAVSNGTGVLSAVHMDIARQVLALHWARGLTAHELEQRIVPLASALTKLQLLRDAPDKVAAAFYERYHIYPAGNEALHYYVTHDLDYSGGPTDKSFADRVLDNYRQALVLLRRFGVQVWHAPAGTELVCSDIGALTLDPAKPLGGPLYGVRWFDAKTIYLPLGPSVVIAAGNPSRREVLPTEIVEDLNQRMVWSSVAHVVHRPGPTLEAWIGDTWRRRPQLQATAAPQATGSAGRP